MSHNYQLIQFLVNDKWESYNFINCLGSDPESVLFKIEYSDEFQKAVVLFRKIRGIIREEDNFTVVADKTFNIDRVEIYLYPNGESYMRVLLGEET